MKQILPILFGLIIIFLSTISEAAKCTTVVSGTIHGDTSGSYVQSGGAALFGGTGCTGNGGLMAAGDDLEVATGTVLTIDDSFGSSGTMLTGTWTVDNGGQLNFGYNSKSPMTKQFIVYHSGLIVYHSGSDGILQGKVLTPGAAPGDIRYWTTTASDCTTGSAASSQNIMLHFGGTTNGSAIQPVLPWKLCTSSCGIDDIHAGNGTTLPPTFLYVDFQKETTYGGSANDTGMGQLVDQAGQWLEVKQIATCDGASVPNTIVLGTPQLGLLKGQYWFGADGTTTTQTPEHATTADAGRGEEFTQSTTGPHARAGSGVSGPGYYYRNAIGENTTWDVQQPVANHPETYPVRRRMSLDGNVRWEILVDTASFSSRREGEGFLACLPEQTNFNPQSERWCARIVETQAGVNTEAGGTRNSNILVVDNDPVGIVRPGDVLNVYTVRLAPGDRLIPVNPIQLTGANLANGVLRAEEGSLFGHTYPIFAFRNFQGGLGNQSLSFSNPATPVSPPLQLSYVLNDQVGDAITGREEGIDIWIGTNDVSGTTSVANGPLLDHIECRSSNERPIGGGVLDRVGDGTTGVQNDVYGDFCMQFQTKNYIGGGSPDTWKGTSVAKVRCETMAECIQTQSGFTDACPGGIMIQDMIATNSRNASTINNIQGNDMIELAGGLYRNCAVDRVAIIGNSSGTGLMLRNRIFKDSGAGGADANALDPGHSAFLWVSSVAIAGMNIHAPTSADNFDYRTFQSGIATSSGAGSIGVTNYYLSGTVGNQQASYRYGAMVDWLPSSNAGSEGNFTLPGAGFCQNLYGHFQIGGGPVSLGNTDGTGCDPAQSYLLQDNTILNEGMQGEGETSTQTYFFGTANLANASPLAIDIEHNLFALSPYGLPTSTVFDFQGTGASCGGGCTYVPVSNLLIDHDVIVSLYGSGSPFALIKAKSTGLTAGHARIGPDLFVTTVNTQTAAGGNSPAGTSWLPQCQNGAGTVFSDINACTMADTYASCGSGAQCTGWSKNAAYASFDWTNLTVPGGTQNVQGGTVIALNAQPPLSDFRWNWISIPPVTDSGTTSPLTNPIYNLSAACMNSPTPATGANEACDAVASLPNWSGPYVYDWPLAWMTVRPVPGFRRTAPQSKFIPHYMAVRSQLQGLAGGGGSNVLPIAH